jgi:hypothetical protein
MQCPSCQHENPERARFCNDCGAALEVRCESCGQVNPAGSRFCNRCGAALVAPSSPAPSPGADAEASVSGLSDATDPRSYTPRHLADRILTQKTVIEGERKYVTVLFSDLSDLADSTELASAIGDPEVMHSLLDEALQLMLAQVHGYEGTINQFTGDGIMALFGAPLEVAERIEHPSVAWRARSLLGEVARRRGDRATADRDAAHSARSIEGLAPGVSDGELRKVFLGLGDQQIADPLGDYR